LSDTRWEQLLRYRFIEIIALWEGRLTTRHLREVFGLGRQQASKDINNYKRSIGPGNLEYDTAAKGYRPSDTFSPVVSRGTAEEYLDIVAGSSEIQQVLGRLPNALTATEVLRAPVRQVSPEILRPLISAAREARRVEVDYVSLNAPDREGRIIVPHTLVWTGQRWHVRGWCEKNQAYRDFVLSRFRGEPEVMDISEHTVHEDLDWHTWIDIVIAPDPRLSSAQQEVVAHDYAMDGNQWRLSVRAKLLPYYLKLLQIDPEDIKPDAQAQQLVILNPDDLSPWLFSSTLSP
jgi:predicted DNA-binding transcriptional regulator YafY